MLAATFERMGIRTGVDLGEVLSAAEEVVRPFIPRLPWMDRSSITQGYAGVYSSFLLHAERAAERYGVPAHEILQKVGEHGYVGGQEDMIIDIALQLAEEKASATWSRPGWLMAATAGSAASGWDVASVAAELLRCEDERIDRPPFTDEWPELDLATGYEIQDLNLQARLDRGEKLIGIKLGLTSQRQAAADGRRLPLRGLADRRDGPAHRRPGAAVPADPPAGRARDRLRDGGQLEGPGVSVPRAMSAVESVWGGAEVIDSRYRDFRFTAGDVAADNASSGVFVTGPVGLSPADSTCRWRRRWWRSTGRSSTPRPALRSRGTRARRSRWPPTTSRSADTPSKPAGSCSPAA